MDEEGEKGDYECPLLPPFPLYSLQAPSTLSASSHIQAEPFFLGYSLWKHSQGRAQKRFLGDSESSHLDHEDGSIMVVTLKYFLEDGIVFGLQIFPLMSFVNHTTLD